MRLQQTGQARQEYAEDVRIRTVLPIHIKRRGGRKHVIAATHSPSDQAEHDAPILTALSRAYHWQRLIDEGVVASGTDIAPRGAASHDRERVAAADVTVAADGAGDSRGQAAEDAQSDLAEESCGAAGLGGAGGVVQSIRCGRSRAHVA